MTVIDLPGLDDLTDAGHPAATADENALLAWAANNDITREGPPVRNGRYRTGHPGVAGSKERSYTRASTWANLIDDSKSLEKWRRRILLRGLQHVDTAGTDWDDDGDLNALADRALARGGVTVRADLGTAIHTACEHIDENRPEALAGFPDRYRPDLDAYRQLLDRYGLTPVAVETPSFTPLDPNDPHIAAVGRIDRIYRTRKGHQIVGDIKTGRSVEWLPNALQAAIYTRATHHWETETNRWLKASHVEQDAAFLIHMPLGTGEAHLIRIDTGEAWARIDAVLAARRARLGVPKLFTPVPTPQPTEAPEDAAATGDKKVADIPFPDTPPADRDEWITGRITTLLASTAARDLLRKQWPADTPRRPPWTAEQHGQITPILDSIETAVQAPFPHADPEAAPKPLTGLAKELLDFTPPLPEAPDWPQPDNGGHIPKNEMEPVLDHYRNLPDTTRALIEKWATQGRNAGRRWGRETRTDPWTERATALTLAATACATHLRDDDEPDTLTRAALQIVHGAPLQKSWTTGATLGALTTQQAAELEDLATLYGKGDHKALTAIGEAITTTIN